MDSSKRMTETGKDGTPATPSNAEVLQTSLEGQWDPDTSLERYFDRAQARP